MSPPGATCLATALLLSPWLLLPRRRPGEIRGLTRLLWRLNSFYCAFWHRLEVMGRDPLPEEGPAILVSNHTCCIDHMLLQAATRRLLGFLIARELYEFWLFRPFCRIGGCIPVRRDGQDVAAMRAALRVLDEGRVVPIFPEGRILPTSGRELGEAKPGVAFIALRANVPVVPAYICGTPETRKVLGSYLTPSRARVYFGPPIDLSDLAGDGKVERDSFAEVTRRLMAAIRELRDEAQGPRGGSFGGGMANDGTRSEGDSGPLPVGSATVKPA
ncbi:MAG: 1-acyl-sn-glycerol-3-phosphate acyltransferase [Planctomycetia bacterium]|nr:1-acyl-sn-glycerol-3-phosphate acyltransferase [Planctomycetia bacterium]